MTDITPEHKKVLQQLRVHMEWNPKDNGENYVIKHEEEKVWKILTPFATGMGVKPEQVKDIPVFNYLFLLLGYCDKKAFLSVLEQDKDPRDKYLPCIQTADKFKEACLNLGKDFFAIKPKVESNVVTTRGYNLKTVDSDSPRAISLDGLLQSLGMPKWNDVVEDYKETIDGTADLIDQNLQLTTAKEEVEKQVDELTSMISQLKVQASVGVSLDVEANGEIPEGKVVFKKMSEVFKGHRLRFEKDWEVPTFEWDGVHPDVPEKDANYIFRKEYLVRVIYGLMTNQRIYIQGHTGSGKTTLVEQVAAYLNWPFARINFDSEITRMDLIGRDTLSTEDGKTISTFVDGILPRVMSSPYITCFDEIDFCRPDVAYVMQAALEGSALRITEDGDRVVKPHPMYRMVATGNTVGQGDEEGMYQGARPQSLAFLDRFKIWIRVDYLDSTQRKKLITNTYPSLSDSQVDQISKYTTEHMAAFSSGNVLQPISPRGILAICAATEMLGSVKEAIQMTMIDRANSGDRSTLIGLVNRTVE